MKTRRSRKLWSAILDGSRGCIPAVGLLLVGSGFGGCTGTEAGNPYESPVQTSLCKSSEEFSGFETRLDPRPSRGRFADPAPPPQLPEIGRIPVWLECAEVRRDVRLLALQIANFRGGCEVEWSGGAEVAQDAAHVLIDVQNESCSVAGCGNCIYDLRLPQPLDVEPSWDELSVDLVRRDCDGEVQGSSSYVIPLLEGQGLVCRPADSWAAVAAASHPADDVATEAYAPCGPALGDDAILDDIRESKPDCASDLTCVEGRCLSSCVDDADCPLAPAERCVSGTCRIPFD